MDAAPTHDRAAGRDRAGATGLRALVVDDDALLRDLAQRVLEHAGIDVAVAADGDEGVRLFAVAMPPFDVVVLDLAMPVMRGEEAFAVIRRLRPSQPVVVTSGDMAESVQRMLRAAGGVALLTKPYENAALVAAVRMAAAGF